MATITNPGVVDTQKQEEITINVNNTDMDAVDAAKLNVNRRRSDARRSPNRTNDISPVRDRRDLVSAKRDAEPFTPSDIYRPPRAQPETDEESPDETEPYRPGRGHGIDDGFFDEQRPANPGSTDDAHHNGRFPLARPNDRPQIIPDVNIYQHKKTLSLSMALLALLAANANQMRYVLEAGTRHPNYYLCLVFLSVSLLFQLLVGITLLFNCRYNVKDQKAICKADKVNNFTMIGMFLITVVNVFISAFGIAVPASQ